MVPAPWFDILSFRAALFSLCSCSVRPCLFSFPCGFAHFLLRGLPVTLRVPRWAAAPLSAALFLSSSFVVGCGRSFEYHDFCHRAPCWHYWTMSPRGCMLVFRTCFELAFSCRVSCGCGVALVQSLPLAVVLPAFAVWLTLGSVQRGLPFPTRFFSGFRFSLVTF